MLNTQSVGARMLGKHFQKEETVKKTGMCDLEDVLCASGPFPVCNQSSIFMSHGICNDIRPCLATQEHIHVHVQLLTVDLQQQYQQSKHQHCEPFWKWHAPRPMVAGCFMVPFCLSYKLLTCMNGHCVRFIP